MSVLEGIIIFVWLSDASELYLDFTCIYFISSECKLWFQIYSEKRST